MIEVISFVKRYTDFVAVDTLDFQVQPGQILGLVGRNGAGKTTTISSLAGISRPTAGNLKLGGHDIVAAPLEAKKILGYIPDDPVLFDDLTIWEHLALTASIHSLSNFGDHGEQLLNEFELTDKRDALARSLSRGMRQKVSVACAYLHNPKVLLFDEPMTGLDPNGIRTLERTIRQQADKGAAIIVSSHMLGLVENLCSHLLVLHEGSKRWFGSMEEMRSLTDDSRDQLEQLFFTVTEHA